MSFMCNNGGASSTATISSGGGATLASDNASGATNTANQFAAKNADPASLLPTTPTLTDSLLQSAQARQAQTLLSNSRTQAFSNAPSGSATGRVSLLG